MMKIVILFFTTYWNQLLIIIGIISYFGKKRFELISKKIEVKFSLFQTQKITAINNFLAAYTALENFFWQAPYFEMVQRKIKPKETDNMIVPLYNNFIGSYYSLFLILDENELKDFNDILIEVQKTKGALGKLYDFSADDTTTLTNNYYLSYTTMMTKNASILKDIGIKFRKSFNN